MRTLHFALIFALASGTTSAQVAESFFEMPGAEREAHLSTLPTLCASVGEWINPTGSDPLSEASGHLTVIHFGNFEDPVSLGAIRDLNHLQKSRHDVRVILSLKPRYKYSRSPAAVWENLKQHRVALPVLLDTAGGFWDCMGVSEEETTLIVSPGGRVLGKQTGPVLPAVLDSVLTRLAGTFRDQFPANREPFYGMAPSRREAEPVLRFPVGIAVQPIEDLIYVSDGLSNRIIGVTSGGNTIHCIGRDEAGYADGPIASARFNGPRGLAFDLGEGVLYVADTYNHRIRKVDFANGVVSTVLGDGSPSEPEVDGVFSTGGSIGFPVALDLDENDLYISTAGPASGIWVMDIRTGTAQRLVARGETPESNHKVVPGGLTLDPSGAIFFTDSHSSTLKYFQNGEVGTSAGGEEHGHGDGRRDAIQFQFPNGLTERNESIYIADTYNHAIRAVQPFRPRSTTAAGTGQRGFADGVSHRAQFNLPMDVAYMNGKFFIADAGNGAIRIFDPEAGGVSTMVLHNFGCIGHDKSEVIMDLRDGPVIPISHDLTELEFIIDLGEDWEVDPEGFSQVSLITRRGGFVLRDGDVTDGKFTALSAFQPEDRGAVAFDLRLFVRNVQDGRQFYRALTLNCVVEASAEGEREVEVVLPVSVLGDDARGKDNSGGIEP